MNVDVWCLSTDCDGEVFASLESTLTPDERAEVNRFRFEADRSRAVVGRGALRALLSRYVSGETVIVSFYTDMAHGPKYGQFIGEDVPAVVRDLLPLSAKREDTFIAGLSMGGYGAFKLALTHPERYAAAASLSGAVDIREVVKGHGNPQDQRWLAEMRTVFGDLKKVPGSRHDLFTLAKKVSKAPVKPRLYQCCGTEDFLYADNIRFRDAVQKLSFDYTYEEGPGEHVWAYWDRMIQNVLRWMVG